MPNNIKVIDLHCDTLYKAVTSSHGFYDLRNEVQIKTSFESYLQSYAIWVPDNLSSEKGRELFDKAYQKLLKECKENSISLLKEFKSLRERFLNGERLAVFTLENAKILDNDISYIKYLADRNIKMVTLTWNDKNCIGYGAETGDEGGLSPFGKAAVRELERKNIIIDISHASDKLFYDVAELTQKPFVASHSNSRKVTNHKRNLTDEQFKIIRDRKGLVGLNFHRDFLNNIPNEANMLDILRHAYYFLSFGGENTLALGSDFDGCTLAKDIENNADFYKIYELFLKNRFCEEVVNKIFFENALNFFENFDI